MPIPIDLVNDIISKNEVTWKWYSVPILVDLVGDLIGKEDVEWYNVDQYDPENELKYSKNVMNNFLI